MEKPLYECKGEFFEKIQLFKNYVKVVRGKVSERFPIIEVGCPITSSCQIKGCRYWIPIEHYDYCVLNIDRAFQCHEIGDLTGISRQAISDMEMKARQKYLAKLRKYHLPTRFVDWIEKEPIIIQTKQKNT
jgi:hypothetical protein